MSKAGSAAAVTAVAPFSDRLLALGLRLRLALARAGAPACAAVLLCAAGVAGWAWLLPQRAVQVRVMAQPLPVPSTLVAAPPPPTADQNLADFYAALGQRQDAEQHVKLLFQLADKAHLTLAQGEYKAVYDKASRVTAYQVTLPVKGPYQAIWQFSLMALRAMPFASLDEVGFRRDNIADASVEARVRLTLYLAGAAPEVAANVAANVATNVPANPAAMAPNMQNVPNVPGNPQGRP